MIKKLFWLIIAFFIIYILLIFKAPAVATHIEQILHIDGFNEKVINFKKTFDEVITNIPSKEEVQGTLNGAIDMISTTKEKIDDLRLKANEYEEKYNETLNYISGAAQKVDELKDKINEASQLISSGATFLSGAINDSGITLTGSIE
ncbi:MAG: hypothetical protein PHH06_02295 [Candidatus Gracilibacteria bacterium]|nr:hypothetical protein [Candidatus Gracilibacteria bacterium]